jgi:hypothetical protein
MKLERHTAAASAEPGPSLEGAALYAGWELMQYDWSLRELDRAHGPRVGWRAGLAAAARWLARVVLRSGPAASSDGDGSGTPRSSARRASARSC